MKNLPPLETCNFLIYGPPKIGKSTFASQFPSPQFISIDMGFRFLENIDKISPPIKVHSWDEYVSSIKSLSAKKETHRVVVIDTINELVELCSKATCEKLKIDEIGKAKFGQGFGIVRKSIMESLKTIQKLGLGTILICHDHEGVVETPTEKYDVVNPTLWPGMFKNLSGFVDFAFYCLKGKDGKHYLRTKADKKIFALDRTGKLPENILLSYDELLKAYGAIK